MLRTKMLSKQRQTMMKNRTIVRKTVLMPIRREAKEKEKLKREETSLKKMWGPRQIDSQERLRT